MDESSSLVSIVTPSLNGGRFIEDTLRSVRDQTFPNIEHIVVDGGSTDETLEILKRYEGTYDMRWVSEEDEGMYDAIEKGFAMAEGEILAWLNADDMYLPWAARLAADYIGKRDAEWVTGIPALWDEKGRLAYVRPIKPSYRTQWIERGWYHGEILGWIQQESVFFSRSLWLGSGAAFPDDVTWAGDYWLWREFASQEDLVTIPTVISGFRRHPDQASQQHSDTYSAEATPDWPRVGRVSRCLGAGYLYDLWRLATTKNAPVTREGDWS